MAVPITGAASHAGRAHRRTLTLVTLGIALQMLAACHRDVGPGGVAVVLTLPKGTVEWASSIDVSFDHSMVALGSTTAASDHPPFRISPRVAGRFRWIGTRTASFVPDRPLQPATRFRCTVPAGLRSVDGKSVDRDVTWEFSTPPPAVSRSVPGPGSSQVAPNVVLVVEFNQAVDPGTVARGARLQPAGGAARSIGMRGGRPGPAEAGLIRYWPKAAVEQRVLLTPDRPLPLDTEWTLALSPGLTGMSGPLPMGTTWRLPFRTYGPFRVRGVAVGPAAFDRFTLSLSNPVDPESLARHLELDPPVRIRGAWSEGSRQARAIENYGVYGDLRAGTTYRLRIRPGLVDLFGLKLEPVSEPLAFTTPDAPPALRILPADAVLETGGGRQLAVVLTNIDRVRLSLLPLTPDRVPLYSSDEPGMAMAGGRTPAGAPLEGARVRELSRRTPRNVADTLMVSTDEALGAGRGGILFAEATSLDPQPPPPPGRTREAPRSRTLLRVTDVGLTAKTSPTSILVWATSLATGEPLPGVDLEIRRSGQILWRGLTDSRGLARGAGLPAREWSDRAGPDRLYARRGTDSTFLTLGNDWSLEPWNFGLSSEIWDPAHDRDGLIYGDRELYRPGETVHLKAVIRTRGAAGLSTPAGDDVQVEIGGPRGESMLAGRRTLSPFGTVDFSLALPPRAMPGGYSVRVFQPGPPGARRWSVYGSFQVAEYRAPSFKVELSAGRRDYQSGEALDAAVAAQYFFGAPLASGTVRWTLTRRPSTFSPPGFDEYSFFDPEMQPQYETLAGQGEARLLPDGRAALNPVLDLGGLPVSLDCVLEAEVRDLTGQAVAAETEVRLHRGMVYAGVRVTPELVKAGGKVTAQVVVLSPEGRPAPAASGRLLLIRREWRSARRLLVGGVIGSESSTVDTTLQTRPLPAGSGPHRLDLDVPSAGCYRVIVEVTDRAGNRQRSAAEFYAGGPGDYAWGWEPGVQLNLKADRERYAPGDTARVLIRSPIRGARALITVEREGIVSTDTRLLSGTSEIVEVPIPVQGSAPNLYVSVVLVTGSAARAEADSRLRLPEFRLGYATLPVDHSGQALAVAVRPDRREAGPGDSVQVALTLRDAAGRGVAGEMSVAVVDEAVLRLLGTKTPDPLGFFYRPRGLGITTSELRKLVRRTLAESRGKGEEPGGGGGEGESFRSLFATTAYWNPSVTTSAEGRASIGFRLPDNLTTFRIMAVAVDAGSRFGSADTTLLVTRPLVVQPATPRFAHAGDRFEVGAVVHNRTARPLVADVDASFEGLEPLGSLRRESVAVPAGQSRRVEFEVTASRPAGGVVKLRARAAGASDGVESRFPVVMPAGSRTEATAGVVAADIEEKIVVPAQALGDSTRLDVTLAPSLLGGVSEAFAYLASYPYGCLEQVGSAGWARLLKSRLLYPDSTRALALAVVDRLAAYQRDDGGFVLWPRGEQSSPFITAYALLVLNEAARSGAEEKAAPMVDAAARYLSWQFEASAVDSAGRMRRAGDWAMALWAMNESRSRSRPGPAVDAALEFLTANRRSLSVTGRVYLALAWLGRGEGIGTARQILAEIDNMAERVGGMAHIEDRNPRGWDAWWYSPARLTGLTLAASARSGRGSPLDAEFVRWLLDKREDGRWGDTQGNVMALVGLVAYREAYETGRGGVAARVAFADRPERAVDFASPDDPPRSLGWNGLAPKLDAPLSIRRSGGGALYYTAALRYLESTVDRPPVEGALTLEREYAAFEAGPAERAGARRTIRMGDLVMVRLTVVLPEAVDFLVLADPLPAGLEAVHLGFVISGGEAARRLHEEGSYTPGRAGLSADYEEIRDREVRAYFDHVRAGVYEYRYLARATTPGRFAAPQAKAELMYHPDVSALSAGTWFEVAGP